MTIAIRNLLAADLDAADAILQGAYGGGSRKQRLRFYMSLQPDGWLLAALDGAPAGVIGAIDYGPFGYIGLVAVHPSLQRRGVALAMMRRLLGWLDGRGCPVALLDASPAGAPLYERLGFVDEGQTLAFVLDDCALPPPASERVVALGPADIPAVAAFDASIFGAGRAAVFHALLAAAPKRAFVARGADGQIDGYLFAQSQTIGPWAARTAADAEALLVAALPLAYDGAPGAIVPSANSAATALLMRYGFSPRGSLRHMRLGGVEPVGRRDLLYGQTSLAIG